MALCLQPSLISVQEIKEIDFKFLRKLHGAYGRAITKESC